MDQSEHKATHFYASCKKARYHTLLRGRELMYFSAHIPESLSYATHGHVQKIHALEGH